LFRKFFVVSPIFRDPLRSGSLIECLEHACLDWLGSLSRYPCRIVVTDVMGSGRCGTPVRSGHRPSRRGLWQISCPGLNRFCRYLLCLPTAPVLPLREIRDFGRSRFYGQFSDKRCLSSKAYGYPNFEHNRDGAQFALLFAISAAQRKAATASNSTAKIFSLVMRNMLPGLKVLPRSSICSNEPYNQRNAIQINA
jgi:hypothetical protein